MKCKKILLLSFYIIFVSYVSAQAFERCIMCGMDAQKSETKFIIHVTKGTKNIPSGHYSLCCLHCMVLLKANLKDGKIGSVLARDYNTITNNYDGGEMIDAKQAYYLIESRLRPKGSMVPFMLIFSTMDSAEIFKKAYGGKILNWKDVWDYTKSR
jgi:nitrous oxide reductase accessory protein NosL